MCETGVKCAEGRKCDYIVLSRAHGAMLEPPAVRVKLHDARGPLWMIGRLRASPMSPGVTGDM